MTTPTHRLDIAPMEERKGAQGAAAFASEPALSASPTEPEVSALSGNDRAQEPCRNCEGSGWVCEHHLDRPWEHTAAPGEGCDCGAGSPCPVCEPEMAFSGRYYAIVEACATVAEAPFDWPLGGAPTTYRELAKRIAANIRKIGRVSA